MSEPRKYRKKPVVIEAMRLTQRNAIEVSQWCGGEAKFMSPAMPSVFVRTLEGVMRADVDDYIIRGVQGEFYPCKPDIFAATYEEAATSDATTPANPTDQIATVAAVLSPETPIVPASGTKRVPDDSEAAVVQDAQRYDWRTDMDVIESCDDVSECADGCCTYFTPRHTDECIRLATHIERLEAERDALRDKCESGHWLSDDEWHAGARANADFLLRYHALLAEHEAWDEWGNHSGDALAKEVLLGIAVEAHDNAERVIRG